MAKAKHWTQLPENKEKLRRQLAKATKTKHRLAKATRKERKPNAKSGEEGQDHVTAYALGHVEAWLEIYARSHHVSPSTLTFRVAELLRRSARR